MSTVVEDLWVLRGRTLPGVPYANCHQLTNTIRLRLLELYHCCCVTLAPDVTCKYLRK